MKEERNRTRFSCGRVGLTRQLLVDFVVKPKKKKLMLKKHKIIIIKLPLRRLLQWCETPQRGLGHEILLMTSQPGELWKAWLFVAGWTDILSFFFFLFVNEAEEGSHERVCSVWTGSQLWFGSHSQAVEKQSEASLCASVYHRGTWYLLPHFFIFVPSLLWLTLTHLPITVWKRKRINC